MHKHRTVVIPWEIIDKGLHARSTLANPLVLNPDEFAELNMLIMEASKHVEKEQMQLQVIEKRSMVRERIDKFGVVDAKELGLVFELVIPLKFKT